LTISTSPEQLRLPDPQAAAASIDRGPQRAADFSRILAHWPGLAVAVEDLDGPGYLVVLGAGRGEILLRRKDSLARRRFTLAHELAHWYLYASSAIPQQDCGRNPRVEQWCDTFAADLLIPKDLLRSDTRRLSGGRIESSMRGLSAAYKVSTTTLRRRLKEIGGDGD
jgi:hypothetical protein